jgi:hypothetical protein
MACTPVSRARLIIQISSSGMRTIGEMPLEAILRDRSDLERLLILLNERIGQVIVVRVVDQAVLRVDAHPVQLRDGGNLMS